MTNSSIIFWIVAYFAFCFVLLLFYNEPIPDPVLVCDDMCLDLDTINLEVELDRDGNLIACHCAAPELEEEETE